MMLIRERVFRGQIPAVAPQHLPDGAAQASINAVHDNGNLRPLRNTAYVTTPAKAGTKRSIHLFAGQFWFHWLTDVDAVRAPVPNDTQERTVFTGDGPPKVTDASIATSGGGALYPNNSYLLGIPAPATAPLATAAPIGWAAEIEYEQDRTVVAGDYRYRASVAGVSGSTEPTWPATVGESVPDGTVTWICESLVKTADTETTAYVETFLRRWSGIDEEGPPSPSSNMVDVQFVHGQAVTISDLATPPAGGYNITHRRLYRVNSSSDDAFQFVAEYPIATMQATDAALSSSLGDVLQTEEYSLPPDDLTGVRAMPNGVLVGFSGKNLCFCEPYQCHAWPTRYRLPTDYPIVGVEVFGSSVLVATEGVPYVATGTQPGYMTMDRTEIAQACVSRRGMADMGSAVAYPSPDGLMLIGSGVAENVTQKIFRREDWQALKPESFVAAAHDGQYFAFYDTGTEQGCLILDLSTGSVNLSDIHALATHVDLLTDTLYLVRGNDIVAWDSGTSLAMAWQGKRHDLPRPACFKVAQVQATAYPWTFTLRAKMGSATEASAVAAQSSGALAAVEDVLLFNVMVMNARPFRLPAGYRANAIEVVIAGNAAGEIESICIGETLADLGRV